MGEGLRNHGDGWWTRAIQVKSLHDFLKGYKKMNE